MSPAVVEAEDLSRWYGEVIGINHATFRITEGVTGILGPNGSGKSTLLNLVTGQIRPSGGDLRVLGERPWGNRDLMGRIGFVPETDTFWEWMTGRRLVEHLTRLHGYDRDDAADRAADALSLVQLDEDAWDRPVGTYSRGMRQKVKIAQALAHDPELLVLDEPLTGADPVSRRHLNEAIRDRAHAGVRVLASSHVLHEVEALTEHVLVLNRGRLVARGSIEAIRGLLDEHPHHIRVTVSEPRRLARELLDEAGVVSVRFHEDGRTLTVETREPDRFYARVPGICLAAGLRLTHLSAPDATLEAVFDYLFQDAKGVTA